MWKTIWQFLRKLNTELPCVPAIPPLGVVPELKAGTQTDTCTLTVKAALFTTAKGWKQAKCTSTDEWISEMWSIYTVEYYSAFKRKEILIHATTRMKLEAVKPSKISQSPKVKYCMILLL